MAYVAITTQLKTEVASKLNHMRSAELNQQGSTSTLDVEISTNPEIAQIIINRLWSPVADCRPQLEPFSHKKQDTLFWLVVPNDPRKHRLDAKLDIPCICKVPQYGVYDAGNVAAEDHMLLAALATKLQELADTNKRWDGVCAQVNTFLTSCKSLNEAVKLWPDVRRYLPASAVKRLDAKLARAEKEESTALAALRNLDLDAINTSTVLARMAGAKV